MVEKILVAYASRTGYTAGVAEVVGKILGESGAAVDVLPMQAVHDLSPYIAVVAGSAIRDRQWLPEAVQFVRKHQQTLAQMPFATFTVCMTLAMPGGEKYRPGIVEWLAPVRALVRPLSEGIFAGGLDINKVESLGDRIKFRISVLVGVWKEGDHRDWQAIRAWTAQLQPVLLSTIPSRAAGAVRA